jgi:hypothetical protein
MPTTKKTPPEKKFDAQGVVEAALVGMTRRLEKGDKPFSDHECRLFVALIQVQNNQNLMSDVDLLEAWGERFAKIEAWINAKQSAEAIQASTRRQPRRQPQPQQFGPGGFDGNAQG